MKFADDSYFKNDSDRPPLTKEQFDLLAPEIRDFLTIIATHSLARSTLSRWKLAVREHTERSERLLKIRKQHHVNRRNGDEMSPERRVELLKKYIDRYVVLKRRYRLSNKYLKKFQKGHQSNDQY